MVLPPGLAVPPSADVERDLLHRLGYALRQLRDLDSVGSLSCREIGLLNTATCLAFDVRRSTDFVTSVPQPTAAALLKHFLHRANIAITQCHGLVVTDSGDGTLALFTSVDRALAAAVGILQCADSQRGLLAQEAISASAAATDVPFEVAIGIDRGDVYIERAASDTGLLRCHSHTTNAAATLAKNDPGAVFVTVEAFRSLRSVSTGPVNWERDASTHQIGGMTRTVRTGRVAHSRRSSQLR